MSADPAGSNSDSRRAPARELLEANHSFPGEYVIKAFGPAEDGFRSGIAAAVQEAVGARAELSERRSKGGRKICITVVLQAQTVDEVEDVYERLHDVGGLAMIL